VDHAARLYASGYAPTILCSGGMSGGVVSEPGAMRDALVRLGVPPESIRVDEGGISTRRTLASARRLGRVLLVSSPYHMHRIATEARRQGVDGVPSPAPSSPDMRTAFGLAYGLREVAAVWWYALRARLA
jgi:SanA protein